jgi:hypothetical protein
MSGKEIRLMAGRLCRLAVVPLLTLFSIGLTRAETLLPSAGIWRSGNPAQAPSSEDCSRLTTSLQRITGINDLRFDERGALIVEDRAGASGGSELARNLLFKALDNGNMFIIEDYSNSEAIHFGQLDEGTNFADLRQRQSAQLLIWRVRIDFVDFQRIEASPPVRAAFDEGFTLLHELLHGLGYSDTRSVAALGECEEMLNLVRAELKLPERARYFGEVVGLTHTVNTIRIRFRRRVTGPKEKWREEYLYFMPGYLSH